MRQTIFFKTGLAVLCGLILTATGLWAAGADEGSTAAAADKKYPRISDKGWIGQGSDQDLAELARYTRFSMWKCGSDIIPRANRLPTR